MAAGGAQMGTIQINGMPPMPLNMAFPGAGNKRRGEWRISIRAAQCVSLHG